MKTILSLTTLSLLLTACNPVADSQDKQIAENEKKLELLRQEAEMKRLQEEINAIESASASDVFELVASEVNQTLSPEAQAKGKNGEIVEGTDGQQYMFDADTGSWLLYGAIGAGLGYLAAQAANNRTKYAPVQRPTAAVERVVKDYQTKQTSTLRAQARPNNTAQPNQQFRQTQQGYSNHKQPTRRSSPMRRRR